MSPPTTAFVATPVPATSTPSAAPSPDLSRRPLVWFTPHPEARLPGFNKGAADYFDLFAAGSDWAAAAGHVDVFKIYDGLALGRAPTDEQYRTVVEGVRRLGMALAIELGPLPSEPANTECGQGVEGFGGSYAVDTVRHIHELGGRVDIVSFDEPFAFGHFAEGDTTCHWSTTRVAQEVASFVRQVRAVEPSVVVGDIEPAWISPEIGAAEISEWLDAYELAAGEPLGFFHLDIDWNRADWPTWARQIEDAVRGRGVPFGIIYNGGEAATSDAEWLQLAAERAYEFEQVAGGTPDHVNFQTWHFYPTRVLPESDLTAFTSLIDRYFGARTTIEPVPDFDGSGSLGFLRTVEGEPVARADVRVTATPLDGVYQTLTLSGKVPAQASTAVIGFRTNLEGAGPGDADFSVRAVSYSENGGKTNEVANGAFRRGLYGWHPYGAGDATISRSNEGAGWQSMHVVATADQPMSVDSEAFDVTPGADFIMSVIAAVPAASAGSSYVASIFLAGTEVERQILRLDPAAIDLGRVTTLTDGMLPAPATLEPGTYLVTFDYPGDLDFWPSHLARQIGG